MKRYLSLLCFLAVITLTFVSGSVLFPFHREANLMPEETHESNTEETDRSGAASEIQEDLEIFLSSPQGSALLAATEKDMDSIPGIYFPDDEDKSLNEIRFDGWTEEDFFNNDYLRAFRRYMDAWLQGKKMDETETDPSVLEPYRERLSGKFVVFQVRVSWFGGLLYTLIPIDEPSLFLRVWIYSTVNDSHIDEYLVEHVEVHDLEEETGKLIDKDKARQYLLETFHYFLYFVIVRQQGCDFVFGRVRS